MKKNGFTLIEILVVVAIIGLLATLGIVSFQASLRRSRDATRLAEMKALQNAAEQFYAENDSEYPTVDGCAQLAPYLQGFQDYNDPRGVAYECDF
nr:type II secretion system protein [Candidatus Woesebacteria bacterium]